jgi:DNA recombination protein RmuC
MGRRVEGGGRTSCTQGVAASHGDSTDTERITPMPIDLVPLVLTGLAAMLVGGIVGWLAGRARVGVLQARLEEREKTTTRLSADLADRDARLATAERARVELAEMRARLESDKEALAAAATELRQRLEDDQARLGDERGERERLATENERLKGDVVAEKRLLEEKSALLEQFEQKVRETFAATSQEALAASSDRLLELATARFQTLQEQTKADLEARRATIDAMVQPVATKLSEMGTVLQAFDVGRVKSQEAIEQQLRVVMEQGQRLAGETQNLVTALRAPQARGRWDEMQLRRVVELAGMEQNVDFIEQDTVDGEAGRLRPDLVVRLPGRKALVVDAKTPLVAYLDALDAVDEAARKAHLDRHARDLRRHIEQLSAKDYANEYAEGPDFVIMFVPGEAFFSAACHSDPGLIEFAVQRGVIPTSPTSCITVLKAVAYGWQQERLSENLEEIRDLGIELHDRMRVLAEHFQGIGRGLRNAVESYDKAVGSLEGRVLPTARKLKAKGAGGERDIEVLEPLHLEARPMTARELEVPNGTGELKAIGGEVVVEASEATGN